MSLGHVSAEQLHPVKAYQREHIVMQQITFAHVRPLSHPALVQLMPVLMAFASADHLMLAQERAIHVIAAHVNVELLLLAQEQVTHVIVVHANADHLLRALEQAIHVIVERVNVDRLILALEIAIHVIVAPASVDQMLNVVALRRFAVMEIALQVSVDRYRLNIRYSLTL